MGGFSANAKTFATRYFLGDKGINIILEAKPIKLGTGATETLYASIRDARHTGVAKPCEPRLRLGQLRQRCYNRRWGSLRSVGDPRPSIPSFEIGGGPPSVGGGIYNFQLFNTPSFGSGGFEILNADGGADAWEEDYNWQNADCKLRIGEIDAAYTAFEDLWHFKTKGDPRWRIHGSLVFEAKLGIVDFEQPIQTTQAASSRLAPLLFGKVKHIRPELINTSTLQYEIDNTRGFFSSSFINVFEGGSIVTSHATLDAVNGRFTLDAEPVYDVTVQAQSKSGLERDTIGEVVTDLLSHVGVTANDLGGFSTSVVGIYVSEEHNFRVGQAVSLALGPRGIWWLDADGTQVSFNRVDDPGGETAVVTFTEPDIAAMESVANLPAIGRHKLLLTKYWDPPSTVIIQDAQEILRFSVGGIWHELTATRTDFPDAISVITDAVPGGTFAGVDYNLTTLFDAARSIYRITLTPLQALEAWLGDYISVTTPKAPGFGTAKNLLVVGIGFDFLRRRVILEAFG